MTFEEWVSWHFRYLEGSGGFWRYWCCGRDGADLVVEPIRFEQLTEEWPWVNGAPGRTEWRDAAVKSVAELCADDLRRFEYDVSRDLAESRSGSLIS